MAIDFFISSDTASNGRNAFYAQRMGTNESKFLIGYKTKYEDNFGLFNTTTASGQVYLPKDYPQYGFWSFFIYPTAMAESKGSFKCLNTYDRAKFTFTFMQYAAHVPNGDFVVFFRRLLHLPFGKDFFPKLVLKNNRIFYKHTNGTLNQLEDDASTEALMNYLNPSLAEIEQQELICSARMVYWASNDIEHRRLQVETAIDHFKQNMKTYHQRFGLHNVPVAVCVMICDIKHQGRAKNDRIAAALNTNGNYEKAYTNLCSIGMVNYESRISTVKSTIKKLKDNGLFSMKYNGTTGDFVKM